MKRKSSKYRTSCSTRRHRRATSALEVIVALTLLLTVLSLSVSLTMRHGRLLTSQRHYRQALDELSNQMDRVTALTVDDVPQTLKQLSLSQFAAARLSAGKLSAELKPTDIGQRVTLHLTWNEPPEQSVSMTGWIFPRAEALGEQNKGKP
jgi:hypothetical protein